MFVYSVNRDYCVVKCRPHESRFRITDPPWWRHQMEIFSALLAICAGNSPVTGEFPTQRPVTRSFDVYFDLRPNERLSKQWWGWWFETLSRSLWRHRNDRSKKSYSRAYDNTMRQQKVHPSLQMTFSKAFSSERICITRYKPHWSLSLWIQLEISHHWFWWWLGAGQATSHYLNQCWQRSTTPHAVIRPVWMNAFINAFWTTLS